MIAFVFVDASVRCSRPLNLDVSRICLAVCKYEYVPVAYTFSIAAQTCACMVLEHVKKIMQGTN